MKESYSIREKMKATHVDRWHIVHTVKHQSLAEHQWGVSVIAMHLAELMKVADREIILILQHALLHDIEEIETGDIPSPYKEELKKNGWISPKSQEGVAGMVPTPSSTGEDGPPVDGDVIRDVVRAADLIETYWWATKYVDDYNVVLDCKKRLVDFEIQIWKNSSLYKAIEQTLTEIF